MVSIKKKNNGQRKEKIESEKENLEEEGLKR